MGYLQISEMKNVTVGYVFLLNVLLLISLIFVNSFAVFWHIKKLHPLRIILVSESLKFFSDRFHSRYNTKSHFYDCNRKKEIEETIVSFVVVAACKSLALVHGCILRTLSLEVKNAIVFQYSIALLLLRKF